MSTLDPMRWRAASAELDRVLELPGYERGVYLASLHSRDAALAADVERLLDEQRALDAEGFLGDAPSGVPVDAGEATRTSEGPPQRGAGRSSLAPGTSVGPYRIVGPLGRGGMGVVFEADEIESGRRVALKVLEDRIHDERERERFDREGRLAASINHPHCVYVFAAWELDGRPAIAMELMRGTLADRLKTDGPLPPSMAVDMAVQLMSGLKAAAALGILHRDVKPSNCFVDSGGTVKIGDFGISRSLRPTEDTALSTRGRFAATPAYASPEQLRGAALDERADIYSLGATLYELVTGRRPFERRDLMSLLMAVANDAPTPPHALVPSIPKGLSRVILRCLAKAPEQRFADYDALEAALEPYASTSPSPATFGRRFVAGAIDHMLVSLVASPLSVWAVAAGMMTDRAWMWQQTIVSYLLLASYFGIFESLRAATPGKTLFRLTLIDARGRPPAAGRMVARAALYAMAFNLPGIVWLAVFAPADSRYLLDMSGWKIFLSSVSPWVLLSAVFSTSRRRNGYAAVHDLLTQTRVVERQAREVRRRSAPQVQVDAPRAVVAHRGPFEILDGEIPGLPAGWRPGFDARLRRPVWIRDVPPGTPPLTSARIAVDRPTRLRWLAGRRVPDEAWDVFEAVAGVPLEQACAGPREWSDVRWWLLDLARECAQASAEAASVGESGGRSSHVWVLETGGAKIVDDPAADTTHQGPSASRTCAELLLAVIRRARRDSSPPWPVGAQAFIGSLAEPSSSSLTLMPTLEALVGRRPATTRLWRALSIAGVAAMPVVVAAMMTVITGLVATQARRVPPDVAIAASGLKQLRRAQDGRRPLSPQDRDAIELALATRYRAVLADGRVFAPEHFFLGMMPEHRRLAEDLLKRRAAQPVSVEATTHPAVRTLERQATSVDVPSWPLVGLTLLGGQFAFVACCALVTAVAFRGGLTRLMGLEIVTGEGALASRLRVLARTALTWSPLLLVLALNLFGAAVGVSVNGPIGFAGTMGVGLLVVVLGAVVAIVNPSRALQDKLAGTWVVPR